MKKCFETWATLPDEAMALIGMHMDMCRDDFESKAAKDLMEGTSDTMTARDHMKQLTRLGHMETLPDPDWCMDQSPKTINLYFEGGPQTTHQSGLCTW